MRINHRKLVQAAAQITNTLPAQSARPLLSYVHGASNVPMLHETLGERLLKTTESVPDKEFAVFRHQNIRRTYAQFYEDARNLATGLLHLGLRPGDRVGIWGPNYYEWLTCQYGTAMAGMVQVNVNPAYQSEELHFALQKVGVKALITPKSFKRSNYYNTLREVFPSISNAKEGNGRIHSREFPEFEHLIMFGEGEEHQGAWNYSDIFNAGTSEDLGLLYEIEKRTTPDQAVNIQYTSGTTGNPKAATLTHHNILNNAYFMGLNSKYNEGDHRLCIPNPLYHCFGCVMGVLNAVVHQQSVVFPAAAFQPAETLNAVEEEKCTALYGTPTMFIDVLNQHLEGRDFSSLRSGYIAGAPCPVALCERMVNELGMRDLDVLYGCTELSPIVTMSRLEEEPMQRIKNVGYAMPHTELCVVDEHGHVVPRGEQGELLARGYSTMTGYYNDEDKTKKEITPSRWYLTGDTASMDESGAINIVGRTKDMIIRGGENIYPTEIEQFLFKLPYVADAQVIGVPDQRFGEAVCAWVRLRDDVKDVDEERIKADCKGKIAHYKVPAYIMIKEEAEFPLTATGKVRKVEMRAISKRELGLEQVRGHFNE